MTRIDRRALFSSGAAAALLAASGVSLDAAPQPGGRLRLALPREDAALDQLVRGAAFDSLTEIAPNGVLQGELAKGWSSSEARIWQFDLREDVRFHDGAPMRANDVVASLNASAGRGRLGLIAIDAIKDHALRLELETPNPHLPFLLSDQRFAICSAGTVGAQLAERIGTGCYFTRRFDGERHYLGEKVPDHYKQGQAGWLDSVEAVVIPDPGVRAEALRDGFVDVAVLPTPDLLRSRGNLVFHPSADDMVFALHRGVGLPSVIATRDGLDDGRLAERWWRI